MSDKQANQPVNNEEGQGIVSGVEPSTEELEQRFKDRHAETEHGSTEGQPDPATGEGTK